MRKHRALHSKTHLALALVGCLFALWGCDHESEPPHASLPIVEEVCIDRDGDGFGPGCEAGPDCDDEDASLHVDCPAEEQEPAPCEEGEERDCKVILGSHNGVTDCFVGVETCIEGEWSACGEEVE